MERYGAYHRVSQLNGRDPDADNYMTEKVAWEQIDGWGKMRGVDTSARYLDRDKTGSKMSRPDLDRMLDDLRAGEIDGIAVAQVDRLSRADVGDALAVIKQVLDVAPGKLMILDLGIDPTTEFGEFGLTVLLALSRMQWRRFKRTWATAQKRAVGRGVWLGPAPFGYRATVVGQDKNGKPIGGPLEPHPDERKIIREAYRIAAKDSVHAAITYLEQAAPQRQWRTNHVRRLLSSRVYLGENIHGADRNPDAHKAIVTEAVWNAAQTTPVGRSPKRKYVLSGIARCGACGAPMNGQLQTVKGHTYLRYRCGGCRGCSISAPELDERIRWLMGVELPNLLMKAQPPNVDEARQAKELAEDETKRFAADGKAREILGEKRYYEALQARVEAEEAAVTAYQALAGQKARSGRVLTRKELQTDEGFGRGLRHLESFTVTPGRAPVADRIANVKWRLPDTAQMPKAA